MTEYLYSEPKTNDVFEEEEEEEQESENYGTFGQLVKLLEEIGAPPNL